jgi:YVTN family beta-propeller protein
MSKQGFIVKVLRINSIFLVILLALIFCLVPARARADGGAPNVAYVAGGGAQGNELDVVDIAQHKVTGRVVVGNTPWAVVLSPDYRMAYVTLKGENKLAIVDANAKKVTATIPTGAGPQALAIDISRSPHVTLYVANTGDDTVTAIDPDAQRVIATIPVGQHPSGVAIAAPGSGISNPAQPEVYVANSGSDNVSIISATTHKLLATIPVPGGPLSVVVPATGGVAYVATQSGTVVGINVAERQVVGTLYQRDGSVFGTMDYDAITGNVYVPDAAHNAIAVLAPASAGEAGITPRIPNEPLRVLGFSGGPVAVAITSDGNDGLIAERDTNQVVLLNVPTRQTLATIAVGGTPHGIVTGAYPPVLNRSAATVVGFIVSGVILAIIVVILLLIWRRTQAHSENTQHATPHQK